MSSIEILKTDRSIGVTRALELILDALHLSEDDLFREPPSSLDEVMARCNVIKECRQAVRQCLKEHEATVKQAEHKLGQLWATSTNEMKNRISRAMLTHDWSEVLP